MAQKKEKKKIEDKKKPEQKKVDTPPVSNPSGVWDDDLIRKE